MKVREPCRDAETIDITVNKCNSNEDGYDTDELFRTT